MKRKSFFDRAGIPIAIGVLCVLLATAVWLLLGRDVLVVTILGMPFPIYLLWLSRDVETLNERYASKKSPQVAPSAFVGEEPSLALSRGRAT